jgi:hypothetical protein
VSTILAGGSRAMMRATCSRRRGGFAGLLLMMSRQCRADLWGVSCDRTVPRPRKNEAWLASGRCRSFFQPSMFEVTTSATSLWPCEAQVTLSWIGFDWFAICQGIDRIRPSLACIASPSIVAADTNHCPTATPDEAAVHMPASCDLHNLYRTTDAHPST